MGAETQTLGPGGVVWAPAGAPHGVSNPGPLPLVVLMGLAPWE